MDMGRRYSPPLPAETTSGSRAEAPLGGGAEVSEQARVSFRTLSSFVRVNRVWPEDGCFRMCAVGVSIGIPHETAQVRAF